MRLLRAQHEESSLSWSICYTLDSTLLKIIILLKFCMWRSVSFFFRTVFFWFLARRNPINYFALPRRSAFKSQAAHASFRTFILPNWNHITYYDNENINSLHLKENVKAFDVGCRLWDFAENEVIKKFSAKTSFSWNKVNKQHSTAHMRKRHFALRNTNKNPSGLWLMPLPREFRCWLIKNTLTRGY